MLSSALHLLDISNHGNDINLLMNGKVIDDLNPQIWTMPVEFRGSCTVCLLILTMRSGNHTLEA